MDEPKLIFVVGDVDAISLPDVCVDTGLPGGTRLNYSTYEVLETTSIGKKLFWVMFRSTFAKCFQIECTVSAGFLRQRRIALIVAIIAGLLIIPSLGLLVYAWNYAPSNSPWFTAAAIAALVMPLVAIYVGLLSRMPPVFVYAHFDDRVVLSRAHPQFIAQLPDWIEPTVERQVRPWRSA